MSSLLLSWSWLLSCRGILELRLASRLLVVLIRVTSAISLIRLLLLLVISIAHRLLVTHGLLLLLLLRVLLVRVAVLWLLEIHE